MDAVTIPTPETSIGQAVLKAREEIKQLREKLLVRKADGKIDLEAVEEALSKTEETLKRRTDEILTEINSRTEALSFGATQAGLRSLDIRKQQLLGDDEMDDAPSYQVAAIVPAIGSDLYGSPGEVAKANFRTRVMLDPQNPRTREVVNEKFGVQLPQIVNRALSQSQPTDRRLRVGDAPSPRKLKQRKPLEVTPEMVTTEAHRGLLNLLERGLLPRASHLTLDPSPVVHRAAALHDRNELLELTHDHGVDAMRAIEHKPLNADHERERYRQRCLALLASERQEQTEKKRYLKKKKGQVIEHTAHVPTQAFSPATPSPYPSDQKALRFTIQHGRVKEHSAEFQYFKNYYCAQWGSIVTALGYMVQILTDYSIPLAFVNGDALAQMAEESEDEKPSREQMLHCLANRREVEDLLRLPGRRYTAQDGAFAAAVKVQTCWRRFLARKAYMEYRQKKWAAGVIAVSWILHVRLAKVRKLLYVKRLQQLENLRARNTQLAELWPQVRNQPHVVLHLPSLGLTKPVRKLTDNLPVLENATFGRLFEIVDPNVDVMYLSGAPITEEVLQFYSQLASLRKAVLTGDQSEAQQIDKRFRIIVPESIRAFQTHNLALSSHVKYSPRALKRIKNFIRGRNAYIVPGLATTEDVYVADILGVPILGSEPEVAQLYSTKSGAKRILRAANVGTAPFEYDIYSVQQLYESFAQLVTRCIQTVKKFLFKMDNEHQSRGLAIVDIAENLPCYSWAYREAERYGDNWMQSWAQEQVQLKVLEQVPQLLDNHARPLNKNVYPIWSKYQEDFVAGGGVIEMVAPARDSTCFSVDCMIEPDGNLNVLCSADHIHLRDDPFYQAAVSIPQCSADPQLVNEACSQIAEACKQRKIVGYFCVDFVTFTNSQSNERVIWATDVKLRYGESLANFQLARFATNGEFSVETHQYIVRPSPKAAQPQSSDTPGSISVRESTTVSSASTSLKSGKNRKSRLPDSRVRADQRFIVASSRLFHSNLSVIQYDVFFQICKASGIGYDVAEQEGSLFLLKDPFRREYLSMVTITDKLEDSLTLFSKNLNFINREAASANTTPKSNFMGITDQIEHMLRLLDGRSVYTLSHKAKSAAATSVLSDGTRLSER